ncbi:VOC family protein [Hoyosella sp. G463]|uniref:VOC family protein n=1 Tax=Lolliginicoccus lacisalsi TaxID=2742202 RepID=A0A927PLU7_9ACTN|nr:VOC family protein [Lolliginicoccus lacisalsi]MBD8505746.1 VOC family protein [Lolliginicoccus lacisalsi]
MSSTSPSVTPYLTIKGADAAIAFYKEVFGATEGLRLSMPDGGVGHAELTIGNGMIMLADENLDWGNRSPVTLGGSPVTIALSVEDVDAVVEKAVAKGSTLQMPVSNEFYGERVGVITDPFGHAWHISTHIEDVSEEELHKRMAAMFENAE